MKKQLLWGMLLLMAGFSSCQKDSFKPAATSNPTPAKVKTSSLDPQNYYADLVLQARKPGENFDTYATVFNGVKVFVTGSPSWNTAMYPNLQNGVPTAGASATTDFGTNTFISPFGTYGTTSKVILEGDAFVIVQGQMGYFNASAFQADIDNFNFAFDVFVSTGASIPFIGDYIKDNYSTGGGVVTTPVKLIRVTTGTHWAVATIDYPAPKIVAPPAILDVYYSFNDTDPAHSNVIYYFSGKNGKLVSAKQSIAGSGTLQTVSVTGTYNWLSDGAPHLIGTLTRTDNTIYTFDLTGDPN